MTRWYSTAADRIMPEFAHRCYTDRVHSTLCTIPVIQTVIGIFSAFVNSLFLGIFLSIFRKGPEAHDEWCNLQAKSYRENIVSEEGMDRVTSSREAREANTRYEERAKSVEELKGEHGRLIYGIFEGLVSAVPVVGSLFHGHRLYYGTDPFCLQKWRPIQQSI